MQCIQIHTVARSCGFIMKHIPALTLAAGLTWTGGRLFETITQAKQSLHIIEPTGGFMDCINFTLISILL